MREQSAAGGQGGLAGAQQDGANSRSHHATWHASTWVPSLGRTHLHAAWRASAGQEQGLGRLCGPHAQQRRAQSRHLRGVGRVLQRRCPGVLRGGWLQQGGGMEGRVQSTGTVETIEPSCTGRRVAAAQGADVKALVRS